MRTTRARIALRPGFATVATIEDYPLTSSESTHSADGVSEVNPEILAGARHGIAIHEAGHAVAAHAVGYEVRSIVLNEYDAICWYGVPVWDRNGSPAGLRRQLTAGYAGTVADILWPGRPDRQHTLDELIEEATNCLDPSFLNCVDAVDHTWKDNHTDEVEAAALINSFDDPYVEIDPYEEVREAHETAADILTEHWDDVERISNALLRLSEEPDLSPPYLLNGDSLTALLTASAHGRKGH